MKLFIFIMSLIGCLVLPVAAQMENFFPQQFDSLHYPQRMEPRADYIFGGHLMTSQERRIYRSTLRKLDTEEARDTYRAEQRRLMLQRAKVLDPEMWKRYQTKPMKIGKSTH